MGPYSSGDESIKIPYDFQEGNRQRIGLPRVALVTFARSILAKLVS